MRNATKVFVSTLGTLMGLAGIEHGIGETLQGNVAPGGIMILSWPDSAFFRIVGGEPAMTIVPNLFIAGILTILISLIFIVWATLFVQRKHGGLVLILLSFLLLLVGGGIFPPVLGMIIGAVGTRINAPLLGWRAHLPVSFQRFLSRLWKGSFIACLLAFLSLVPGIAMFGYFTGIDDPRLTVVLILSALGFLLLTIVTGFAHDLQSQMN